jgi:hypothetical protein
MTVSKAEKESKKDGRLHFGRVQLAAINLNVFAVRHFAG